MAVTEFFAGEIATELLRQLFMISARAWRYKSTAEQLIIFIEIIQPSIKEIQYSGVELPAHRQAQIGMLSETLEKGKKLTEQVLKSHRWNMVRQLYLVKKMEKLEKTISTVCRGPMLTNILADVNFLRASSDVRFHRVDRSRLEMKMMMELEIQLGSMKIGGGGMIREATESADDDMEIEIEIETNNGSEKFGVGLEMGKWKVKKMMFNTEGGVIEISGMGSVGKTTLARELERDDEVQCYFKNRILFVTVSQSPILEELREHIWEFLTGCEGLNPVPNWALQYQQKLVILDDVWTREALDRLAFNIPGCTTLVVSRSKLAEPEATYGVEVLKEVPTILVRSRGYLVPNPDNVVAVDEEDAMEEEAETEETEAKFLQPADTADEACSFNTNKRGDSSSTVSSTSPIYPSASIITSWQKGQLLGRGSFGSVYEGFSGDGDFFAVKEVSLLEQGSQAQDCIQQLEGEIELLSQLQHQSIVRYRGTAKDGSNLYIFLELVSQGSLLKLYRRYRLRDSVVSVYTRQILDGLRYLHGKGCIHRDIKCANILVDASGAVKLADFGLAKVSKLNDVKSCRGSPFWMAPEVINPRRTGGYGISADIWSLGCTVLEMLTGQIPYCKLESHVQAMFQIGRGVLPEISDTLSTDSQDFILKCLKVNPEERPTAAELLNHPFVRRPLS
ncbi:unnamed protein product [Microthlaspi erraticum]|uniref:mitogen-activated protein kinase kinase kinase n=1 Tax=Microthlaspi erraticum TaxID=1685480 RepID=A0A6D2I9U4_9BRAS|nr:unnamed protein product [Microthlaspi erraticum]